jgi:hypothetical protein
MTAPKPPPERITMYKHATGALHADCPHRTDPHVYIHEAAVEKRERALRSLLEQALDSLESAIGWLGTVAADDALRTVEAIRHELTLTANAAISSTKEEKSE